MADRTEQLSTRRLLQKAESELERTRMQLAGCSAAALGYDDDITPDSPGWSASFEDVRELRKRAEKLREISERQQAEKRLAIQTLREALEAGQDGQHYVTRKLVAMAVRTLSGILTSERDVEASDPRVIIQTAITLLDRSKYAHHRSSLEHIILLVRNHLRDALGADVAPATTLASNSEESSNAVSPTLETPARSQDKFWDAFAAVPIVSDQAQTIQDSDS